MRIFHVMGFVCHPTDGIDLHLLLAFKLRRCAMKDSLEGFAECGGVAEAVALSDFLQKQPSVLQICGAMTEFGTEREMAVALSKSLAEQF